MLIPHQLAESFGWDEHSTVELLAEAGMLLVRKKAIAASLDELLASIPADFRYSPDVDDFTASESQEWL